MRKIPRSLTEGMVELSVKDKLIITAFGLAVLAIIAVAVAYG